MGIRRALLGMGFLWQAGERGSGREGGREGEWERECMCKCSTKHKTLKLSF